MAGAEVANWIAFGGLAFLLVSAAVTFAFMLGKVYDRVANNSARIKVLEDERGSDATGKNALDVAIAEIKTMMTLEVKHMKDSITELRGDLRWLRKGAVYELDQPETDGTVGRRRQPPRD